MKTSALSKISNYIDKYDRSLLFSIDRQLSRTELGIARDKLPFYGYDIWNAFEVSWLNKKGKPEIALCRFIVPCDSDNLIESKSFKLYLNSFNNSKFYSMEEVKNILQKDVSDATGSKVKIQMHREKDVVGTEIKAFNASCLDELDVNCDTYSINSDFLCLSTNSHVVEETVYSNLLKTNCPVTGQPDWSTVLIKYNGRKIDHDGLLKYIVSLRNHNGFHEHCVEQMFVDIMIKCAPEHLTVYARYTRRGGLDINPIRTTDNSCKIPNDIRLFRQ